MPTKKNQTLSCRKWMGTLNNPSLYGYTQENVIEKCKSLKNIEYLAFAEETAPNTQTLHYHFYIYRPTPIAFSTLKNLIPECHWDKVQGSSAECRDYVFKEGKWLTSEKRNGHNSNSHYEFGKLPQEMQGCRTDLAYMYELVKQGLRDSEIIELCPDTAIKHIDKIGKLRLAYLQDKYKCERRLDLKVHYIFGKTGKGKSRDILDEFSDENVYRVTDYNHPFDLYQCQPVLVFEEYRSSLSLHKMLNYLDIYPITLPARFSPKIGCFHSVYVVSNWPFELQYSELQKDSEQKTSYEAWVRRFNGCVKEYTDTDVVIYPTMQEYLERDLSFHPVSENPFTESEFEQQSLPFYH